MMGYFDVLDQVGELHKGRVELVELAGLVAAGGDGALGRVTAHGERVAAEYREE